MLAEEADWQPDFSPSCVNGAIMAPEGPSTGIFRTGRRWRRAVRPWSVSRPGRPSRASTTGACITVPIAGAVNPGLLHSFILGFSRYQHLAASLDIRQPAIFAALERASSPWAASLGRCCSIIPAPSSQVPAQSRLQPALSGVCPLLWLLPRACWPGRAQTKGKVERPFQMIEETLHQGQHLCRLADFARRLSHFAARVLKCPHPHRHHPGATADRLFPSTAGLLKCRRPGSISLRRVLPQKVEVWDCPGRLRRVAATRSPGSTPSRSGSGRLRTSGLEDSSPQTRPRHWPGIN